MEIKKNEFLDMEKIMESGQCFRMKKEDYGYSIVAFGRKLRIEEDIDKWIFSCSDKEYEDIWKNYFDMETNYLEIGKMIREDDNFLIKAEKSARGIRILRQDPFEMIITFIISQRKNIPAIKKSVESICRLAGTEIEEGVFSFPSPESLNELTQEDLRKCSLGYRAPYIKETTEKIVKNKNLLQDMEKLGDEELHKALKEFKGVGDKVSDCVRLFAYHRLNAFPKDVWINRVLDEEYNDGFPFEDYYPYNGVMQQFMFYYRRQL